jgi:ankyrin repeat protein
MKFFIAMMIASNILLAGGFKPIHKAVMYKDIDKVKSMIEVDGVGVQTATGSGLTPLHVAIKVRALDIASYLLDNDANIDAADKNGYTPLHLAVKKKRLFLVRFLVNSGANVNVKNKYGITPLHQAAYSGELDIVEYLVNKGADPLAKNLNGSTPYDLAKAKENSHITSFLEYYNGE